MKTQFIQIGLTTLLLACFLGIQAQPPGKDAKIRQWKIAFFTEKLNLTPEEAQVFWPVYNAYSKELGDLRFQQKQRNQNLRRNMNEMSDQELEKIADEHIASHKKEVEISTRYHEKFKQVLPIRKVIRLIRAEEQFKQMLITKLRERQQQRQQRWNN